MRYKFSIFNNCLFCFKELPPVDKRKGEGEHIIPKNIYGFWTSRDICEDCKIYFGKNIDVIPKKNIQIIEAIKSLNVKKNINFAEGLIYNARDKFTKEKIQMYKKGDGLKVKAKFENQKLNLDENDIMSLGLKHVIESRKGVLSIPEIEEEYEKMNKKYLEAGRGDTIRSEKLKMYMRKGALEKIKLDPASSKLMSPLIAKIVIFVVYYFLYDDLERIHNITEFKEHARNEKAIEDWKIQWLPPPTLNYDKYHAIELDFLKQLCVIDIRFFRSVNWRVFLPHDDILRSKFVIDENRNKIEFERMGLLLDFENELDKKLYWKYQEKGKEETSYIRIN